MPATTDLGPHDPEPRAPTRERAFGAAAARTSLVVGTALTLINHPGILWDGVRAELLPPLLLNYLVPFLVAGWSRHRLLARLPPSRDRS